MNCFFQNPQYMPDGCRRLRLCGGTQQLNSVRSLMHVISLISLSMLFDITPIITVTMRGASYISLLFTKKFQEVCVGSEICHERGNSNSTVRN